MSAKPQNVHHMYAQLGWPRVFFFFCTTAVMEILMRRKKNVVCLHSSELIGQTRTGVAPAWITWSEKKKKGISEHFIGERRGNRSWKGPFQRRQTDASLSCAIWLYFKEQQRWEIIGLLPLKETFLNNRMPKFPCEVTHDVALGVSASSTFGKILFSFYFFYFFCN